jgi:hypothetical protein
MTRGNPDHSTREALLTYLRVDPQPVALIAITRYMKVMHKKDSGAVRECLRRLMKAGLVTNPSRGIYQWGTGERAAGRAGNKAGGADHNLV